MFFNVLISWLRQFDQIPSSRLRLLFGQSCQRISRLFATATIFFLQIKLAFESAQVWRNDPFSSFWLPIVVSTTKMGEVITQPEKQFMKFPIRR
ncbi:hypothetical protein [Spirosoma endbachense]|uniref:Uncharacterized protein n=1 Tax=Spirosoma endbachense TaxID=2666025 RepID=A0A6P1W077_9BACT|nr:hypothetical protein [Spirosoma endbachense]QHV97066.1 hypothetical protein GJR95_19545 [Spirosoma endbachense]